jgi:hypothetical protein
MTAYQAALDDFASRQAERAARADAELQHLKQAVVVPLRQAGIARVEIRFDGYGDSGAIEEIVCLDAAGQALACPEIAIEIAPDDSSDECGEVGHELLRGALESLGHLALERHHRGWELNDGAAGELVIDVAAASFTLGCSLRYTATEDHSTEL